MPLRWPSSRLVQNFKLRHYLQNTSWTQKENLSAFRLRESGK
jgi:hypothetical protein